MNTNQPTGPLFSWTQAIYLLHAFSLVTGIIGAATIIGAFLTGWPSIIAAFSWRDSLRSSQCRS